MAHQSIDMRCPGCGAPVSTDQTICNYCYRPIIISTFNSVNSMSLPEVNKYAGSYRSALAKYPDNTELNNSIAMCYLKLKVYRSPSLKSAVASLQLAITNINSTVCDLSRKESALKGMGATLIIFVAYGPECAILNIGDSRAYHYSAGRLVQITKDNTEGQRMLALGLLTRKELSNFPARKNLSRYIG